MTNKHIGYSFESFLKEKGIREETEAVALKRVLAWKIQQAMREQALSKKAQAGSDGNRPIPVEPAAWSGKYLGDLTHHATGGYVRGA
jgi:hypothetical protein